MYKKLLQPIILSLLILTNFSLFSGAFLQNFNGAVGQSLDKALLMKFIAELQEVQNRSLYSQPIENVNKDISKLFYVLKHERKIAEDIKCNVYLDTAEPLKDRPKSGALALYENIDKKPIVYVFDSYLQKNCRDKQGNISLEDASSIRHLVYLFRHELEHHCQGYNYPNSYHGDDSFLKERGAEQAAVDLCTCSNCLYELKRTAFCRTQDTIKKGYFGPEDFQKRIDVLMKEKGYFTVCKGCSKKSEYWFDYL